MLDGGWLRVRGGGLALSVARFERVTGGGREKLVCNAGHQRITPDGEGSPGLNGWIVRISFLRGSCFSPNLLVIGSLTTSIRALPHACNVFLQWFVMGRWFSWDDPLGQRFVADRRRRKSCQNFFLPFRGKCFERLNERIFRTLCGKEVRGSFPGTEIFSFRWKTLISFKTLLRTRSDVWSFLWNSKRLRFLRTF